MKVFDIKQIKIRVLAHALTLARAGISIFFSVPCIKDAKAKNSDQGEEEEVVF
jgi:hypothetical protein